jgi:Family of unknown function (DUF6544)
MDANSGEPDSVATVTEQRLADLPPPVRRSLSRSGVVGRPVPIGVTLQQRGTILMRDRWLPFTADQTYALDPPAFRWLAAVKGAGLPIARAEDTLDSGRGRMHARLFGLIPLVDASGPEMDQGALLRWLNETMWFPQAWATDVISWSPIDERSAIGSVSAGGLTVDAEFRFDDEGRLTDFRADRFRSVGSAFELSPWATPISAYARFDGVEVPAAGSAIWMLDDGDLEYIRIEITDLRYAVPGASASSASE